MDRQREKQLDPAIKWNLRHRSRIVEPVFGHIKEGFGFRRFTMLGLLAARAQWGVMITVKNLRTLYKHWVANPGLAAV